MQLRRSQTTILSTLAVIAALLFMSQFPVISPVSNIHPDDTDPDDTPFNTDEDTDGIPDVHEILFQDWINFSAVDGRFVQMQGLNKTIPDANLTQIEMVSTIQKSTVGRIQIIATTLVSPVV